MGAPALLLGTNTGWMCCTMQYSEQTLEHSPVFQTPVSLHMVVWRLWLQWLLREGLRVCAFKELLSFSDRNTDHFLTPLETVAPRSKARINHARNTSSISSSASLDWEIVPDRDCLDSSEHLTSLSHISSSTPRGNAGWVSRCLGFEKFPGEFLLAESPRMASP